MVSGFDLMAGADCMVETPPGLGLAVLSAPEPLHYYSLFSHTIGYDVVVRQLLLAAGHHQWSPGFEAAADARAVAGCGQRCWALGDVFCLIDLLLSHCRALTPSCCLPVFLPCCLPPCS